MSKANKAKKKVLNKYAGDNQILLPEEDLYKDMPDYIPEVEGGHPYTLNDPEMNGWYVKPNKERRVHFIDGKISHPTKPAIVRADGSETWMQAGKINRDGADPAVILNDEFGRVIRTAWYRNNKCFRDDKDKPSSISYHYANDEDTKPQYTYHIWHMDGIEGRKGLPAVLVFDVNNKVVVTEFIDPDFGGLHNNTGPARITKNRKEHWFCNKLHCETGPAIEVTHGKEVDREYWLNNVNVDKKAVDKMFATGASVKNEMRKEFKVTSQDDNTSSMVMQDDSEAKEKAKEAVAEWAKKSKRRLIP